jgi:hypothetical protein
MRHLLYANRYFQKKLGVKVKIGWNPDSFGHNAQLPQILSRAGVSVGTLERCPPELSADLVDRGFVMAGGGSLLRNIDKYIGSMFSATAERLQVLNDERIKEDIQPAYYATAIGSALRGIGESDFLRIFVEKNMLCRKP